jgi:hypothetical protein
VIGYIQGTYQNVGAYEDTLSNNAAFTGLKDKGGKTDRWTVKGGDAGDGEDVTINGITADGTIGGRFTNEVWTTKDGELPGLRGKSVAMPEHLKAGS